MRVADAKEIHALRRKIQAARRGGVQQIGCVTRVGGDPILHCAGSRLGDVDAADAGGGN